MNSTHHINHLLEEIKKRDFDKYQVLIGLRNIVHEIYPHVSETFKYGGILFSLTENFGGLFVSKNHVSFEFTYGYKLSSSLTLKGSGKYRRHLKIKSLSDHLKENLKILLIQIGTLDKS